MRRYLALLLIEIAAASCTSSPEDATPNTTCSDANLVVQLGNPNIQILTPNAISPNSDNLNEVLIFTGLYRNPPTGSPATFDFSRQALKVYTATRQLVYENPTYRNTFDGRNTQGQELPEGTYFYEAVLDNSSVQGNVTIVRSTKTCGCRTIDQDEYLSDPCR